MNCHTMVLGAMVLLVVQDATAKRENFAIFGPEGGRFIKNLVHQSKARPRVRGGCATFGHSCYGGMGKRASEIADNNAEDLNNNDEDPAFIFTGPRSSGYKQEQYDNVARLVRQWIQQYRRAHTDNNNNI